MKNWATSSNNDFQAPSFFRRLGALLYDALIVFAWLWAVTAVYMYLRSLGFDSDDAYKQWVEANKQSEDWGLSITLLLSLLLFYVFFWMRGGQTLGMQAWRIKVVPSEEAGPPFLTRCIARFFLACLSWACFGLGFAWALFDPNKQTAHDRLSKTKTILLPKDWHQQFQK